MANYFRYGRGGRIANYPDQPTDASARQSDPQTSHDAAKRTQRSKLEDAVYRFMVPHWPRYMTSLEIAEGMGVDKWSISPRFRPLYEKGYLDEPVTRPGMNSNGHIRDLQAWRVKKGTP